jgi:hypothetical protein
MHKDKKRSVGFVPSLAGKSAKNEKNAPPSATA